MKTRCFSVAIFYEEDSFHNLLFSVLIPFFERKKSFGEYYLSLSKTGGNHIKLFICIEDSAALQSIKDFDNHVKRQLKKTPFNHSRNVIAEDRVFYQFPTNTVHYGIYDTSVFTSVNEQLIKFKKELSNLLVQILDEIGESALWKFTEIVIELFMNYTCNSVANDEEAVVLFKGLFDFEIKKFNTVTQSRILDINLKNYSKNSSQLVSYVESVLKNPPAAIKTYQRKWIRTIDDFSQGKNVHSEIKDAHMLSSLCDAFGLTIAEKLSVYYMLSKSIEECSNRVF